jgi:hypothetical protein
MFLLLYPHQQLILLDFSEIVLHHSLKPVYSKWFVVYFSRRMIMSNIFSCSYWPLHLDIFYYEELVQVSYPLFQLIFFFLVGLGLNSGLHTCKVGALMLETHIQYILLWLFWRWGVSQTTCPGWPWTLILLISASQVARITGVSHQCLAQFTFYACVTLLKNEILCHYYKWKISVTCQN